MPTSRPCATSSKNRICSAVYKTHKERVGAPGQIAIYKAIEDWAADKTRSEVVRILKDQGLLAAPVLNDKEVYESEHYRQRGTVRWMDDPLFGDVVVQSGYSCGLMSKTPRKVKWLWRPVGADNVKIYHELLGYPMTKIEEWYIQRYSLSGGELCVILSGARKKLAVNRATP